MNELINDLREENEQLKLALEKAEAERDEARRESLGVKSFLRRYRYRIKGGEQTQSYIDDVLLGRNGFINKFADDFAIEQQIKGIHNVLSRTCPVSGPAIQKQESRDILWQEIAQLRKELGNV